MICLKNHEFSPEATFECGQCFRWSADGEGYVGVAKGRVCRIRSNRLECPEEDNAFWRQYFCLDMDYTAMRAFLLEQDPVLKPCLQYGQGLRILRQDLWETIVSFILSANNNIPRIKKMIEGLCCNFGEPISFEDKIFYSFPSVQRVAGLTCGDLASLKLGYRDAYVLDAAAFMSSQADGIGWQRLTTEEARQTLMQIKGVGRKVADCILLFALGRYDVFPQDVWIRRIMGQVYQTPECAAQDVARQKYGAFRGFAQQYLFYYYRNHAGKI